MRRALLAALLSAALAGGARAESEGELRGRIEEAAAAIREADGRIAGALAEIDVADRRIAELRPRLEAAAAEERRLAEEAARLRAELAEREEALAARRARMAARARLAYKLLQGGRLRFLFAEGDFARLGARMDALFLFLREDRAWIDRGRELVAERERARAALEEGRLRAEAALAELRGLREEALREKSARRALASKLRLDKKRLAAEESAARAALARALARLAPARRPAEEKGGAERLRGWFARPVKGRILREFKGGSGAKFAENGVAFAAEPGEPVLAAQDGTVLYSGWFKGYGQMLVLDHGSSLLSVYAHLERLLRKPGDGVLKSDPIGRAGEGGIAEGPGVYFEIRLKGRALDPAEWIRAE